VADSLHGHGEKQAGTRYAAFNEMKEFSFLIKRMTQIRLIETSHFLKTL
jgi:hypothetical protein